MISYIKKNDSHNKIYLLSIIIFNNQKYSGIK